MIPLKDDIPSDRPALVTYVLIAINVVAYLVAIRAGGSLLGGPSDAVCVHYGAIPYAFTHPGSRCELTGAGVLCQGQPGGAGLDATRPPTWLTALTGMFMHGSLLHLAGNMLFLFIFADNVEDSMGRLRFLAFYLLGGLGALALQILVDPSATGPTLGASGAIAAVLGGYILLYPRARVLSVVFIVLFFGVVELPALALLGVWFAEQALLGAARLAGPLGGGGGIAYFAHVGGFLFGLALIRAFVRRRGRLEPPLAVH